MVQNLSRLESLKSVHNESAKVFVQIEELETTGAQIQAELKEDHDSLSNVQSSMTANLAIMKDNMKSLQVRLDKLKS